MDLPSSDWPEEPKYAGGREQSKYVIFIWEKSTDDWVQFVPPLWYKDFYDAETVYKALIEILPRMYDGGEV